MTFTLAPTRRAPPRPRKACAGSRRGPLAACTTHLKPGRSLPPAASASSAARLRPSTAASLTSGAGAHLWQNLELDSLGSLEVLVSLGCVRVASPPAPGASASGCRLWRGKRRRRDRRGGRGARRAAAMAVGVGLAAGAIGAALGAARRRLGRPWAARGAREVGFFTLCVPPSVFTSVHGAYKRETGYTFVLVAESAAVRADKCEGYETSDLRWGRGSGGADPPVVILI